MKFELPHIVLKRQESKSFLQYVVAIGLKYNSAILNVARN